MQAQQEGLAMDRRGFLKLGLTGSWALSAAGAAALLSGCSGAPAPAPGLRWLRAADATLLRALFPALLAGSLAGEPVARERQLSATLRGFDELCVRMEPPAQTLLRQLFDLLHFAPARRLAAGVARPWSEVTPLEAEQFLARWTTSRVALYNAAYRAFAKITAVAYFAQPETWPQSGYPGPPAVMQAAVAEAAA